MRRPLKGVPTFVLSCIVQVVLALYFLVKVVLWLCSCSLRTAYCVPLLTTHHCSLASCRAAWWPTSFPPAWEGGTDPDPNPNPNPNPNLNPNPNPNLVFSVMGRWEQSSTCDSEALAQFFAIFVFR